MSVCVRAFTSQCVCLCEREECMCCVREGTWVSVCMFVCSHMSLSCVDENEECNWMRVCMYLYVNMFHT